MIGIIDGDAIFTKGFVSLMKECLQNIGLSDCKLITSADGEEFIANQFQVGQYFMLLLDTCQTNLDGIELAREIRKIDSNVPIIFISSVNDYAMESYQVNAAYFMLKPTTLEDCYKMLAHVLCHRCSQNWIIRFPDGFRCFIDQIIYISKKNNGYILYLDGQQHTAGGMDANMLEQMLRVYQCFYQVNKENVVNLTKLESIDNRAIRLSNGHYIALSKKQIEMVRTYLMNTEIRQSTWK